MTYISLDVEILKVEGMLPNVNADDGDVGEEGILVSSSYDLQTLGGRIVALRKERQQPEHSDTMEKDIRAIPNQNPGSQQSWC
jgi:hypothetical protein